MYERKQRLCVWGWGGVRERDRERDATAVCSREIMLQQKREDYNIKNCGVLFDFHLFPQSSSFFLSLSPLVSRMIQRDLRGSPPFSQPLPLLLLVIASQEDINVKSPL